MIKTPFIGTDRRTNMKSPDKIYLQRVPSNQEVIDGWTVEPVKHTVLEDIEYIRKDALMEWAKEKYNEYKQMDEDFQGDVFLGNRHALAEVIQKIESL